MADEGTGQFEHAAQPEPQHYIAALEDENAQLRANRLYLLAMLRQRDADHAAERVVWEAERASLLAKDDDGAT